MNKFAIRCTSLLVAVVIITISLTAGAFADGYTFTRGQEIVDYCIYSTVSSELKSAEILSGALPQGMNYKVSAIGLLVYGTPTAAGTVTAEFRTVEYSAQNGDFESTFPVTITVVEPEHTELTITKSPTSETVELNGSALFIAAAENYSTVQWRVVNADGSSCWRGEDEIESGFPGVVYNASLGDDGREYLELSSIPASMNKYYVQVLFTAANGEYKLTEQAFISVNGADDESPLSQEQPEEQLDEVTVTEELTEQSEEQAEVSPEVTVIEVTPEPDTQTETEEEPKTEKKRADNIGIIVLASAALVGVSVSALVYISLRKAEKKRGE